MKEAVLQKEFVSYFERNQEEVFMEVPFMSRVIDVVTIKDDKVITYELKIKDWQKAMKQMSDHRIGAHYCYLCMPQDSMGSESLDKISFSLKQNGYGFIVWDQKNKKPIELVKPQKSKLISQFAVDKIRSNIEMLNNGK